MPDIFTKEKRSEVMSKIKSVSQLEKAFAKMLSKKIYPLGYRYRLNYKGVPGRPDIAFVGRKIAVFVDGSFWHGYQFHKRRAKLPSEFWVNKIENNMRRDRRNRLVLKKLGWTHVRLWEHDIKKANDKNELLSQQKLLNSLEDKNNQIRAIFAVQKLNEGWDVLNLFDIVRLYETRDGKDNKPGKTTISEAQLVGRGARYFPFSLDGFDVKDRRKFDRNLDHELRILEELHYHSHNESRYIAEIKTALKEQGLWDEDTVEVELRLKESFRQTKFFKSGLVYRNEKKPRSYDGVKSISDLGVSKRNVLFSIKSGLGEESGVFIDNEISKKLPVKSTRDVLLKDVQKHIIQNALTKNDFFEFANLKKYFPKLESMDAFIADKDFSGLGITFEGMKKDLEHISSTVKLEAIVALLNEIENQIKTNSTEYIGTREFVPASFNKIFESTKIRVKRGSEREDGHEARLEDQDWYVFNANYGTTEEKDFVKLIYRQLDDIKKHFKDFYLVRNERQMKIYNFKDGMAFEPDFLFFGIKKNGQNITYQLFIEPKGRHLAEHDKWKNDFLEEIRKDKQVYEFKAGEKYKILGVPFYTNDDENAFKDALVDTIK